MNEHQKFYWGVYSGCTSARIPAPHDTSPIGSEQGIPSDRGITLLSPSEGDFFIYQEASGWVNVIICLAFRSGLWLRMSRIEKVMLEKQLWRKGGFPVRWSWHKQQNRSAWQSWKESKLHGACRKIVVASWVGSKTSFQRKKASFSFFFPPI